MISDRWKFVLLMILAVATLAIGEALIARGMKQAGDSSGWWAGAKTALTNGSVIAGTLVLGVHLALYATALAGADLSLVMPLTAASYPLGTLLSRFLLHEDVNVARWVGTAVIALGVAVVAWGEAKPSP
jgi:bacterial/archaeal transporter family protein